MLICTCQPARHLPCLLLVALVALASPSFTAQAVAAKPASLTKAVRTHVNHSVHRRAHSRVVVSQVRRVEGWAYGNVLVPSKSGGEGVGIPTSFIARRHAHRWRVALKGTKRFGALLGDSPRSLVPSSLYAISQSPAGGTQVGGVGGGGPAMSLPWATGQTWSMYQGPHNTTGAVAKPWTSMDFSGGDGIVRAAADGVVYRPCANLVVVDHGGGWETGYYHLVGISASQGQAVHRGDPLGRIGTGVGCGGSANGAHVHFSIYHFPSAVGNHTAAVWHLPTDDLAAIGQVIGGWLVQNGARPGQGCLQRISDGAQQCAPSAQIGNDGVAGNGLPVAPPAPPAVATPAPPAAVAPAPQPPPAHLFSVHNTCLDGACGLKVRQAPSLGAAQIGVLYDGATVNIRCQGVGDMVTGGEGSNDVWDQIDFGSGIGWVADLYMTTPGGDVPQPHRHFSAGIPRC